MSEAVVSILLAYFGGLVVGSFVRATVLVLSFGGR